MVQWHGAWKCRPYHNDVDHARRNHDPYRKWNDWVERRKNTTGVEMWWQNVKKDYRWGNRHHEKVSPKKAFSCTFLTLAKLCNTVFVGFFQLWIQKIWKCFEDWCAIQGVEKIHFPQPFPQSILQKWRGKDLGKSSKNSSSFSWPSLIVLFFSDNIQGWRGTLLMIILKCGAPGPVVSSLMRISQKLLKCGQHLLQDGNWTLNNWGIPKKSRVFLSNIFPFKWWSFTNNPTRTKEFKTMPLHKNHHLRDSPSVTCHTMFWPPWLLVPWLHPHSWDGLERVAIS